jgi:hypothetical protein
MTLSHRMAIVLGVVNLALLVFLLGYERAASAPGDTGVLRGQGLELVDASGRVRAQFNVEADGEAVFRMRDSSGTIRVKLGASDNGSGLLLIDETTEPGVQLIARRAAGPALPKTTSITLSGPDGKRRTIEP